MNLGQIMENNFFYSTSKLVDLYVLVFNVKDFDTGLLSIGITNKDQRNDKKDEENTGWNIYPQPHSSPQINPSQDASSTNWAKHSSTLLTLS